MNRRYVAVLVAAFVAVFVLGTVFGRAWSVVDQRRRVHAMLEQPPEDVWVHKVLSGLKAELHVDASQEAAIRGILERRFRAGVRIRSRVQPDEMANWRAGSDEIRAVLRDDQRPDFDATMSAYMAQHERAFAVRPGSSDGGL